MDFPLVLLVLVALPFAVAALILGVSFARRRAHAGGDEPASHRLQADTAAMQDAVVYAADDTPRTTSGRERRAASAGESSEH